MVARIQLVEPRVHLVTALDVSLRPIHVKPILDHEFETDPNPWRGYRKCLTDLPNASHVLVIQDDAVACEGAAGAIMEIAEHTDVPVCLFVPGAARNTVKTMRYAARAHKAYARIGFYDFVPAVAVLWPREKAIEFMEWSDGKTLYGRDPKSDDAMIGHWMRKTKQTILVTVPSLFDHPDEEVSVVQAHRTKAGADRSRVAAMPCTTDPLSYKWSVV